MSYRVSLEVSPSTLRALLDYQAEQAPDLAPADLADIAICEWLQQRCASQQSLASNGYFWKTVFLPQGSRLRISSCRGQHYAEVVGGELIYDSQSLSPNQFVLASLGNVGNAWKVIQVQLPGESDWTQALRLRHAADAHALRSARRKAELVAGPQGPASAEPKGK